jgi:hypothetical protein
VHRIALAITAAAVVCLMLMEPPQRPAWKALDEPDSPTRERSNRRRAITALMVDDRSAILMPNLGAGLAPLANGARERERASRHR